MKSDPDFHPLAGAWLDGTAAPTENRLLDELLAGDPRVMDEYAALCRTEGLLQGIQPDENERREALRKMLIRKVRSGRFVITALRRPSWKAVAAITAVLISVWYFWPGQRGNDPSAQRRRSPLIPRLVARNTPAVTAAPGLPPAGVAGWEKRLRHIYVPAFQARGTLPEAAEALTRKMWECGVRNLSVRMDFKDTGDSPVYVHLDCALPAWTLVEILALQSGTTARLSGDTLVFQKDPNAEPQLGSLDGSSPRPPLRLLLGLAGKGAGPDEAEILAGLVETRFDKLLTFKEAPDSALSYTGSPRMVKVLNRALGAEPMPVVKIRYDIVMVNIAPGADFSEPFPGSSFQQGPPPGKAGVAGVFTEKQMEVILNSLADKRGVKSITIPAPTGSSQSSVECDLSITGKSGEKDSPMKATFLCSPGLDQTLDVYCQLEYMDLAVSSEMNSEFKTQVLIWKGQTVSFGGLKGPGGERITFFVTPVEVDADGRRIQR